jgi:lysine 6-dehydrogenase
MGYRYAILGAGRQGIAAAYDLAKFGDPQEIVITDIDYELSQKGAKRINDLMGKAIASPLELDVGKEEELFAKLDGTNSILSAVPYQFNLGITQAAIRMGANMCDLGGHTRTVLKQREFDSQAKERGITIVPDCGMGPGMNISLAIYAMSLMDEPREVCIWDGGLPQDPKPPWNYALTFNIGGLTNEYFGNAIFLRDGKITEVPCFEGYEELDFPLPLNRLEAFVTSGGLSTMPWTFEGKLNRLENKTLRYPGHVSQFRAFSQLGLFEEEPIDVKGQRINPREVFHTLLEPKIRQDDVKDVAVIRVKCVGEKDGKKAQAIVELFDHYDEKTGFTAMQRLTGWHESIVSILCTRGKIEKGVLPIETVSGKLMVEELKLRGFKITEDLVLQRK